MNWLSFLRMKKCKLDIRKQKSFLKVQYLVMRGL